MTEFVAFPVVAANQDPAVALRERIRAVNQQGRLLVQSVVRQLPELQEAGIVVEAEGYTPGQRMYEPGASSIAGGWREVSLPGRPPSLMRVMVACPEDTSIGGAGFLNVEIADRTVMNGMVLPGKTDKLRVDIDEQHGSHVSGFSGGSRFTVDTPNPNSQYADFGSAQRIMRDAEAGLHVLLAPTSPVPEDNVPPFVPLVP